MTFLVKVPLLQAHLKFPAKMSQEQLFNDPVEVEHTGALFLMTLGRQHLQSCPPLGLSMQLHELLNLRSPYVILSTGEVHWQVELVQTQGAEVKLAEHD
jgi:hypothetical protein